MLRYLNDLESSPKNIAIYNDRFGYLGCHLATHSPFHVLNYKSQEKALRQNLEANDLPVDASHFLTPFAGFPESIDVALIKIPKSLDLFRLFLIRISEVISSNG